ncbi:MAG: heme exporter protein CcmB [Planctomycetes bacterium]|nr:heme exporter protein CcmB [Planctomycetota bacterium]
MSSLRLFLCLVRWDVLREIRRKDILANMTLFALLVLFVAVIGVGPDAAARRDVGPVMFWVAVVFAGTVGLSQAFAAEREGGALAGVVTSPLDVGLFYLAKVSAAWLYVMLMEILVLGLYSVLFSFSPWDRLGAFLGVLAVFTLGYMAAGVVLAAMTTALRGGGEILLRILLVPLMLPFLWLVLRVSETLFGAVIAGGALGGPLRLPHFFLAGLAFDTMYLATGYLLFPKVLEE